MTLDGSSHLLDPTSCTLERGQSSHACCGLNALMGTKPFRDGPAYCAVLGPPVTERREGRGQGEGLGQKQEGNWDLRMLGMWGIGRKWWKGGSGTKCPRCLETGILYGLGERFYDLDYILFLNLIPKVPSSLSGD